MVGFDCNVMKTFNLYRQLKCILFIRMHTNIHGRPYYMQTKLMDIK